MIDPVNSPQNNPKSDNNSSSNNNNSNNNTNNIVGSFHSPTHIPNHLCYEPTSVLDLRRSPSPVGGNKPAKVSPISDVFVLPQQPNDSLVLEEPVFQNLDWDTIMRDLGLHDDSVPSLKTSSTLTTSFAHPLNPCDSPIPHFSDLITPPQSFDPTQLVNHHHHHHHHNNLNFPEINLGADNNNYNFKVFDTTSTGDFHPRRSNSLNNNIHIGFDFIEDLIRVADCFDSDDSQLAQAILDRLNQRLRSNISTVGKPLGRPLRQAALYFKDALQSILSGSNRTARLSSWSEIVQTIRAYKAFSGISPIPMFSHFTTNQALLEALNGSAFIHVVDFDIGLGGQYASLMKELAEKSDSLRLSPPVVRITAVVPEEYAVESRLIKENLSQFAQELKIRFQIEFVLFRTFEILSFKAIKFMEGEKTAVLLSTAVLRRLSGVGGGGFLTDVRRISPAVVVLVDGEGLGEVGATTSFRRSFVCGLELYSMVMDSLDAAMVGGEWVREIEAFVLRPRIAVAVEEAAARRTAPFREMLNAAGMRPVQLSQFADFQAECLLGKVQVRGFHVVKRQAELVLCWHDRALVATSVWRC